MLVDGIEFNGVNLFDVVMGDSNEFDELELTDAAFGFPIFYYREAVLGFRPALILTVFFISEYWRCFLHLVVAFFLLLHVVNHFLVDDFH